MDTLKVKCYLFPNNVKISSKSIEKITEIRRFNLQPTTGGKAVYNQLVDKIKSSFGQLVASPDELRTYWLDEENELIGFASRDEMNYAIELIGGGSIAKPYDAQSAGPVFKVFVANAKQTTSANSSGDEEPILHYGVVCDGCNGSVIGMRYKCKQCPDFDLCSACKAKSMHSEHEFTEISKPLRYFPDWATPPTYPFPSAAGGAHRFHHFGRGGHHHRHHHKQCHTEKQPQQPDEAKQQEQQKPTNSQQPPNMAHQLHQTINDFIPYLTSNIPHVADQEHLKNLGEHMKNLLHPFGIDVSYYMGSKSTEHAQTPTSTTATATATATAESRPTTTTEQSANPTASQTGMETNETELEKEPLLSASAPPKDASPSPYDVAAEALKKMVVSEDAAVSAKAATATSSAAAVSVAGADAEEFNLVDVDYEIRIVNAIEQLRAMGYGDENGWLTRLATSKRGDINAVLDALKPTNYLE